MDDPPPQPSDSPPADDEAPDGDAQLRDAEMEVDEPPAATQREPTPQRMLGAIDGMTVSSANSRYDDLEFTLDDNISLNGGADARVGRRDFMARMSGTGRNRHREYLRRSGVPRVSTAL